MRFRHSFAYRLSAVALSVVLCFSLGQTGCNAGNDNYIRELLDVNDGLSDNSVRAILCDNRGIIWIGTQFGVEWYDGYKLRHVQIPGRLNVNVIHDSMFENGDDIIVCTLNGLLIINKDGRTKQFIDMPLSRPLVRTPDGKLWIASLSKGLRSIDPEDCSINYYSSRGKFLAVDDDGNLFQLGNDGTVCRFGDDMQPGAPLLKVSREHSRIFILGNYLFAFSDLGETEIFDMRTLELVKNGLPEIRSLVTDAYGRYWCATSSGLHILNKNFELEDIYDESGRPVAVKGDYSCLCLDLKGGIWAGLSKGLEHFSPNRWSVKRINVPSSGAIFKMVFDDNGEMWFVGRTGGLFRYDPESSRVEHVETGCASNSIRALYPDGEYMWLSTWRLEDHAVRIDRKTLNIKRYDSFPGQVSNFCRNSEGRLWISAPQRSGYQEGDGFVPTTHFHFSTMVKDSSGCLWAGIKTVGIIRDIDDGVVIRYSPDNKKFPSRGLLQLSCAPDGRIWALADGDGLFTYDSASDIFVKEDAIPYEYFGRMMYMHVCQSNKGGVLISSNLGLIRFDPLSGDWSLLNRRGIFEKCFNGYSICESNKGELYLGSEDGFLVFDIGEMLSCDKPEKITFTSFSVIQPTIGKASSFRLKEDIDKMDAIVLPHSCNSFRIFMTDMDFNILKTGRLVYKLDGYSRRWHSVKNGAVDFIGIPTGRYKLLVRSIGSDGALSGEERSLKIRVKPPVFVSPLAILGYLVILIASVMLIIRRSVRKSKEKLMAESALKEAESEKTLYASKVEFLSSIAHEIKTPLSLVKLPIESIAKRFADTKDIFLKEDIDTLRRNSDVLSQLIEDLLDFQKLEHSTYKIELIERNICTLTKEIIERFTSLFDKNNLKFTSKMPSNQILAEIDTRIFDKILSNLLSNAAKYSETYIRCSLARKNGMVVFKIENDGVIVPVAMRERIFSAFVRFEDGRHYIDGTGIGLYSSRKFASLLGGSLQMDGDLSVNRFILSLPIVQKDGDAEAERIIPEPVPTPQLVTPLRCAHSLLLVDDNQEICRLIERNLNGEFDVRVALDGLEALDLLESGYVPSIIVTDVMMPNMDGLELCRRIKGDERFSMIPVVILTAKSGNDVHLQSLETRADAYLQKPFSMDILQALLKSQLENRKLIEKQFRSGRVLDLPEVKSGSPDNKLMIKVQEYIVANISNNHLMMEDLADYCSVSLSSLQKKMKRITGMSPAEYLMQFRLKEALRLLADKSLPLSEVSIRLGFSTHSHFSYCFKRIYGVTPGQWRENLNS